MLFCQFAINSFLCYSSRTFKEGNVMNELESRKSIINSYKENYNENLDIKMTKEEIFIFIQLFLNALPESLDPLSDKFIPIIPIFQVSFDTKECPFDLLRKWPYSRLTAYVLGSYAYLQKMLLTKTTDVDFENKRDNGIQGVDPFISKMLMEQMDELTKYAIYVLNSENKEERNSRIEFVAANINGINSVGKINTIAETKIYNNTNI